MLSENMQSNIVAGLISSLIIIVLGWVVSLFSKKSLVKFLRQIFYEVIGIGIDAIYPNLKACEPRLRKLCQKSSEIHILSFGGFNGCDFLFDDGILNDTKTVEILLADPEQSTSPNWVEKRALEEECIIDNITNQGMERYTPYTQKLERTIFAFERLQRKFSKLKIYKYNSQAIWAMFIFDNKVAFIGGYTKRNRGRNSTYYEVSGKSLLLDIGIRHYTYLKDHHSCVHSSDNN